MSGIPISWEPFPLSFFWFPKVIDFTLFLWSQDDDYAHVDEKDNDVDDDDDERMKIIMENMTMLK